MKDTFGHLRDDGEELSPQPKQPEDEYSDRFREQQDAVRKNQERAVTLQREEELRRDTDPLIENEDFTIGLIDIDESIEHMLTERFNLIVEQDGERVKVPVIYDDQERWAWAQKKRNLKSVKDKVLLPIVVFKRDSVNRNQQLENQPTFNEFSPLGKTFVARQRYSKQNRYDAFSKLNNLNPVQEYYVVRLPSYVTVNYSFRMYTEYMYQMNKIVEQVNYFGKEYWGDPESFLFKVSLDSINTSVEDANESRYVRGEFNLEVSGYLIPERFVDGQKPTRKDLSVGKVVIEEKVVNDLEQ
jgi:hypothetical protein